MIGPDAKRYWKRDALIDVAQSRAKDPGKEFKVMALRPKAVGVPSRA